MPFFSAQRCEIWWHVKQFTNDPSQYDGTNDVSSTYNIENKGAEDHKVVDKATYQTITGEDFAGDSVTPISNTKGTELPSTGGIGTTIFYIVGGMLLVGAAVILVARRKAQD